MFHISLEHESGVPMYLQIYQYFVREIRQGHIVQKEKLPSGRELAQDLGISRNTINMAYEQLELEGYIEAKPKRGYFVCSMEESVDLSGQDLRGPESIAETKKNHFIQEMVNPKKEYKIDFSPFGIDLQHAPYNRWKKIMRETMLDHDEELFQNGDSQGDIGLRMAIRDYLYRSRGVNCSENQIIVGAGTDYLLMLLTRLLPDYHRIAMENPVYRQAYHVFQSFQYDIVPIPMDEGGIKIQNLRDSQAELVFVTPSHQFPLGIVMPIHRRMQLLNWAREQADRYIIEDDYDSEFRYQGKPIPSLQGIDTQGKVIYMGTFSKAIAPSIRIGYMVLPESLCKVYREQASFYATTVSRIDQEIVRRFLTEGYFERHLNRMRGIYRSKHDCLMNRISKWRIPVKVKGDSSGLHIVLEFTEKDGMESEIVKKAETYGVKVYPLSNYYIEPRKGNPTILLGYANLTLEEIEQGLCLLEKAWGIPIE